MSKSKKGKLDEEARAKPAEKPVSLHPLKFKEAVRDLLRVKPRKFDTDQPTRTKRGQADG